MNYVNVYSSTVLANVDHFDSVFFFMKLFFKVFFAYFLLLLATAILLASTQSKKANWS